MKLKIIDLLRLVYEDKAPKKIKWNENKYEYIKSEEDYTNAKEFLFMDNIQNFDSVKIFLNQEIEILEEKPKEIENWSDFAINRIENEVKDIQTAKKYLLTIVNTQKEIIDRVNYLLKKEDE